jgi:LacI family transcriptional regulator
VEGDRPKIFLLLDPAAAYDAALLRGIADFSVREGRWRIFRPPPFWEGLKGPALMEYVRRCDPDGLILIEPEDLGPFRRLGVPLVVSPFKRPTVPGAVNIVTDHGAAGRLAARHLLDCGFPHFAYCGYSGMFWSEGRWRGFEEELAAHGHVPSRLDTPPLSWRGHRRSEQVLLKWLRGLPKPCGIMAAIDVRAWQLGELCATAGLPVPDAVGIVGVDNDELLCTTTTVPLSSVALGARAAGAEAARSLDRIVRGAAAPGAGGPVRVRPTHVEARLSTDFLNVGDPVLVRALRFIRGGAQAPMDVGSVARHAGVSRRRLEKRFREKLDRPVLSEIRRVRAEAFARMLRETNLPVGGIADRLGFPGPEHVSRFFRSETGLSPTGYRRSSATAARGGGA